MNWLGFAVAGAVGAASACQVLSGVGFALICSPLLIIALGHGDGVRITLVMSIILNCVVLLRSFRDVRLGDALRLLVPAAVFVVPTLFLGAALGGTTVLLVSGLSILLATAVLASGRYFKWLDGTAGALSAGAASGVLNVLAAASGPPVALFAAHRGWPPPVTAATLQAYALPLNLVTLVGLGAPSLNPASLGWATAGLVAGTGVALPFSARVSARVMRVVTLAVAAVGGLLLVARALW